EPHTSPLLASLAKKRGPSTSLGMTILEFGKVRNRSTPKEKSARELRQGGSDYRCCIPALAGFVSPQSIVPDGDRLFAKNRLRAIVFSGFSLDSCPATSRSRPRLREGHVRLDPICVGLVDF